MNVKIYGQGGHAQVILDLINQLHEFTFTGFFDDANEALRYTNANAQNEQVVIGIGNNKVREKLANICTHSFATLIHPNATVSKKATIGEGSVILAGAVIQANAVIGKHVIINANVVVDHDTQIGDYASIYPGAYIGSYVSIEPAATIHANQVVTK